MSSSHLCKAGVQGGIQTRREVCGDLLGNICSLKEQKWDKIICPANVDRRESSGRGLVCRHQSGEEAATTKVTDQGSLGTRQVSEVIKGKVDLQLTFERQKQTRKKERGACHIRRGNVPSRR